MGFFIKCNSVTPLFKSIMESDWGAVKRTLEMSPKMAKRWTKLSIDGGQDSKLLPLHQACSQTPTVEVIRALIETYPKALKKTDPVYGRLPIHIACLKIAPTDVISCLLDAYQPSARITSSSKRLALHYACASGACKEVVALLLSVYPEAVQWADLSGWLPIHLVCIQNGNIEICKMLTDLYPQSVFIKTKKGNVPEQCLKLVPDCENKRLILSHLKELASKLKPNSYQLSALNTNMKMVKERCAGAEFC